MSVSVCCIYLLSVFFGGVFKMESLFKTYRICTHFPALKLSLLPCISPIYISSSFHYLGTGFRFPAHNFMLDTELKLWPTLLHTILVLTLHLLHLLYFTLSNNWIIIRQVNKIRKSSFYFKVLILLYDSIINSPIILLPNQLQTGHRWIMWLRPVQYLWLVLLLIILVILAKAHQHLR